MFTFKKWKNFLNLLCETIFKAFLQPYFEISETTTHAQWPTPATVDEL
jgi:hypothetical protein